MAHVLASDWLPKHKPRLVTLQCPVAAETGREIDIELSFVLMKHMRILLGTAEDNFPSFSEKSPEKPLYIFLGK